MLGPVVTFFCFAALARCFRSPLDPGGVVARSLPVRSCQVVRPGPRLPVAAYSRVESDLVDLYFVESTGRWRLVDPDAGQPVCVCPSCWPAAERALRRAGCFTVRQLVPRPAWGRMAASSWRDGDSDTGDEGGSLLPGPPW